MNFHFTYLVLMLGIVACGEETLLQRGPSDNIVQETYSNQASFLESISSNCSQKDTLNIYDLSLSIGYNQILRTKNFESLINGSKIQSKMTGAIQRVIHSYVQDEIKRYRRDYSGNYTLIDYRRRVLNQGVELELCPDRHQSLDNTLEGAALNISYYVDLTKKKVSAAAPDLKLSPIDIRINSRERLIEQFEVTNGIRNHITYRTDGAYYDPARKSITFSPQSIHSWLRNPFWEIPMVPSHEYGHHIFMGHSKANIHQGPLVCFDKELKETASVQTLHSGRKVSIDDVVLLFNEGFADLISYYVLDGDESSILGVPCLEVSRDVGSRVFIDGTPKSFSGHALKNFFSKSKYTVHNCRDTDFQDPHFMGAIFAYNADKILSQFTKSKEKKLETILGWVKFYGRQQKRFRNVSPPKYLRNTFLTFIEYSYDSFNQTFDQASCQMLDQVYDNISDFIPECK